MNYELFVSLKSLTIKYSNSFFFFFFLPNSSLILTQDSHLVVEWPCKEAIAFMVSLDTLDGLEPLQVLMGGWHESNKALIKDHFGIVKNLSKVEVEPSQGLTSEPGASLTHFHDFLKDWLTVFNYLIFEFITLLLAHIARNGAKLLEL